MEENKAVNTEAVNEEAVTKPAENKNNDFMTKALVASIALIAVVTVVIGFYNSRNMTTIEGTPQENAAPVEVAKPGIVIDNSAADIGDKISDPFANRYVTYQGLTDIVVGKDMTYQLQNPNKEDDIYMTFTITENDSQIESTDFIPAGKAYEADFSKLLGEGNHKISVLMQPYIQTEDGNMLACPVNNAQTMTVNVEAIK